MTISTTVLEKTDLSQEHSGPCVVIELCSQILVKSVMSYQTFDSAMPDFAFYYSKGPYRLIQESDLRWYLNNANANYRAWVNDEFVGPDDWRDINQIERKYETGLWLS